MAQKNWYKAPILGALTWFGFHCGSGFASGTQLKIYALEYGSVGLIAPLVAWVACAWFIAIVTEYARVVKAKSYRDVGSTIYWDNPILGRVILLLWDLIVFSAMIVTSGACVSGFGTLLNSLFGVPYYVGCGVFVIFMICLMCFGSHALERLGKVTIPMVVMFLILAGAGIATGFDNLKAVLTTELGAPMEAGATIGNAVWSGFTYGCIQISFLHTSCIIGGRFQERKQTFLFIAVGFILNLGCMMMGVLALLADYPGCMAFEMPILEIATNIDGPMGMVLLIIFNIVLLLAYITTVGSLLAGSIARYTPLVHRAIKNEFICKVAVVLVIMGGASVLSTLGLEGVLDKGYGMLSRLKMPIWFFPIIILGPISIHRARRKLKLEQETE